MRFNRMLLGACLLMVACTPRGEMPELPILLVSNCEEPSPHWINESFLHEVPEAHSGKKVSVTDSVMPYSIGVKTALKELSDNRFKAVVIDAYVYADAPCGVNTVSLVASLDANGKNDFWFGSPINPQLLEPHKWVHVQDSIPFPGKTNLQQLFTGYVLNNSKNKVLVDDVGFRFVEE